MRDFVREISDVLKSWKKYAHTRLADETIDKVMMHVEERLKNLNPVLSLYGAYNAGKSTLLNALLGAEVATTGDSPETFKIDEYNWGGWTIYDTPGVDAPIEHEELTEDHLRKSECILFVLSTDGDLEVRAIYERLAKLAQRGKPVLLVLNDKSGLLRDNDADRLSEVYERIDIHLDEIWKEQSLGEIKKPERSIVNAQSALKARLSAAAGIPKTILLEKSYLPALEHRLESFLRCRGQSDVINGLVDYLRKPFDDLTDIVVKELDNPAMQEIAKARNKLDFEQCKLLFEVEKRTKNCLSELAVNLSSYDDEDGNAINGRLQKGLNELCMTLDDILSESLVNVSAEFQTGYIGSMIELSNIDVTVNIDREESAFDDILSAVNKNTKGMPRDQMKETFKKFLTQKFVTGSAEAGTELMKGGARKSVEQVAKSGVKNTTKNMGKAAGKNIGKNFIKISGKTIGVCVDFAFAVYDITMALRVQKQYERQMIAKAQAVENMVSRLRSDVHSEIMRQMSKSVQDYFSVLLHELDKAENNLELAHSDSLAILDNLRNMYDQLAQLKAV